MQNTPFQLLVAACIYVLILAEFMYILF